MNKENSKNSQLNLGFVDDELSSKYPNKNSNSQSLEKKFEHLEGRYQNFTIT
jgi:hypothetical protein